MLTRAAAIRRTWKWLVGCKPSSMVKAQVPGPGGPAAGSTTSVVPGRLYHCPICNGDFPLEAMFILDECHHKFCKPCLVTAVGRSIRTEITCLCPLADCKAPLSVQDMTNLLPPKPRDARTVPTPLSQVRRMRHSTDASRRLMKELQHIKEVSPTQKLGIDANPVDDNLYVWEIAITDFEATDPIAQDMRRLRAPAIVMQATFPPNYPNAPPFLRVLRPRFQFRTGHVTVGGSICMELLTAQGWTPSANMLSVLLSVRAAFIEGGARLDLAARGDYGEEEAIQAFHRLLQVHGWQ
eukprot:GAFH01001563.1.p1 GENE.GAFH01001563.1~~GAFH01001563.1.p1  ORF type:complete len:295 (-),score=86.49 GAFH01001563.1:647-1531(-)